VELAHIVKQPVVQAGLPPNNFEHISQHGPAYGSLNSTLWLNVAFGCRNRSDLVSHSETPSDHGDNPARVVLIPPR
jgi:hypothetical protein